MIQKFPSTNTVILNVIETKGGHVICYVINKIFYNTKNYISNEIENIFVEHLIPKTKPITIGTAYKPPDQTMLNKECQLYVNSETLKYWVGVQWDQSCLMGRRCLFSLGKRTF